MSAITLAWKETIDEKYTLLSKCEGNSITFPFYFAIALTSRCLRAF